MEQLERECIEAFRRGDKRDAERLLPQIRQPDKVEIYKILLETTITVNGIDFYVDGSSLLHLAAMHGWMDVVVDLITKYKCDANCKDGQESIPLHYASAGGHLEVVKYLINEQLCDPMTKDVEKETPLHYACKCGHLNIVQYLINEQRCDPMSKDKLNNTPLHCACRNDHAKIMQYLLSTGKVDLLARMVGI